MRHLFYEAIDLRFLRLCVLSHMKAPTHIRIESTEPADAANPIGRRVSENIAEARYEPGIRINSMEIILCTNPMYDFPYAQKYPVKQK